jgi:hypothetical protein
MKTLFYIAIIACLAIFSCKQNEEDKPIPDTNSTEEDYYFNSGSSLVADCSQPCSTAIYKNRDEYFPYLEDELIYFKDEFGNIDSILAKKTSIFFINSVVMHRCDCFSYIRSIFVTSWDTASNSDYILIANFAREYMIDENTIESSDSDDFLVCEGLLDMPQGLFKFEDQIEINGENFSDVFTATCMAPIACTQVEKLVFGRNIGLMAYFKNGQWWKKA